MLSYNNHFIGNGYLLSAKPEIIDITGTNKLISMGRPDGIQHAAGNILETDWFSGITYFSANDDIPEKYKYVASGIREYWRWFWTGGPITGSSDSANYVPTSNGVFYGDSGYALDLRGYTANIKTDIVLSAIVIKTASPSAYVNGNYTFSGAFFDNDCLVTSISTSFIADENYPNNNSASISLNFNNLIFSGRPSLKYFLSSDANPTAQWTPSSVAIRFGAVSSLDISYSITATATK